MSFPPPALHARRRAIHLARRALSCLALAASLGAGAQPLPEAVQQALQQAQVPAEALAAVVLPAGRGAARWRHQADRVMQPASTLKLLTSIVALDRLGPNHRGFAELLTRAPQQGDVLAGDLVLRGGASPEFDLPQLWAMLLDLRQVHGIREIAGDIVIDRTLFRPVRADIGEPPFDEKPEFAYNLIPDALQLNSHLLRIELSSETATGAVAARALPALPDLQIDASGLRLTDRPCEAWSKDWVSPPLVDEPVPGQLRVRLQGGFPKACTQRPSLQLIDRQALAERQLRWLWASLGGVWTGRAREADQPLIAPLGAAQQAAALPRLLPGAALVAPGVARAGHPLATPLGVRVLATHEARPWGELMRTMNKWSSNAYTRLLYLSLGLGAMADEPGATTAALADKAVRAWLAEQRIDARGLVLDNGSGLSRSERCTPLMLGQVLQAAQQGRWAPELLMSLPLAGVDGTMRNRLQASPAAGTARLKTGGLRNVSALAGYVADRQGRQWVLVAMVNHDNAAAARPALDALVDWVAQGGLSTRPAGPGNSP